MYLIEYPITINFTDLIKRLECQQIPRVADDAHKLFRVILLFLNVPFTHRDYSFLFQMLCHDVLCYTGLELVNGACELVMRSIIDNGCFSLFVKLTATEGAETLTEELFNDNAWYRGDFQWKFEWDTGLTDHSPTFLYFYQSNAFGFIDYIVVYVTFFCHTYVDKFNAVNSLMQLKHYEFRHEVFRTASFKVEPALYNLNFSDLTLPQTTVVVNVAHDLGTSTEKLTGNFNTSGLFSEHCPPHNKTNFLTKLHHCRYIQISKTLLPMEIENGFLFFYEDAYHSKQLKVLSKWEYDSNHDKVSICLEDYLAMYQMLPDERVSSDSPSYSGSVLMILNIIYFLNYRIP